MGDWDPLWILRGGLVVFFVVREIWCWVFKTNEILDKMPRDVSAEVDEIKKTLKVIEELAGSNGAFNKLFEAETAFIRRNGRPEQYVEDQRNQMFPH